MKKFTIAAAILLLAAGCGQKTQPVITAPATSQTSPSAAPATLSSALPKPSGAQPAFAPRPGRLTLSAYADPGALFGINYTSDFKLFNNADLLNKVTNGENTAACYSGGAAPSVCFVLKGAPYKPSNLVSAAVSIRIRKDKSNIGDCAAFPSGELGGFGHLGNPVSINGVAFVTAVSDDAAGGTETQIYISRAFSNGSCYEIDEAMRWAAVQSFAPPRLEVDKDQVLAKLDSVRGSFRFQK